MAEEPKLAEDKNIVSAKVGDFASRLGIVGELMGFLWRAKMWWLIPMVIALLLFAVIIIVASAGPAGPMIYTLF